ncbi:unnamed protein product [Ixodes pacificus]
MRKRRSAPSLLLTVRCPVRLAARRGRFVRLVFHGARRLPNARHTWTGFLTPASLIEDLPHRHSATSDELSVGSTT